MVRTLVIMLLAATLLATGLARLTTDPNGFRAVADETDSEWRNKNIETIDAVRKLIAEWADSWREKNMDRYMSYYSRLFHSNGLDYTGWMKKKALLFASPGKLSLEIRELGVVIEGDHASVSFIQHYQDAKYSDIGEKTIHLVQNNGRWLIISEKWRPLGR